MISRINDRNRPHWLGTVKEIAERYNLSLKQVRSWKKEGILEEKLAELTN